MARITGISKQMSAFLDMIGMSEGTRQAVGSDDGYNVIVGGTSAKPNLFKSYLDHPRKLVQVRPGLSSTAAGRYQDLAHIYDSYKASLHLSDFSPASQDRIAIQLIHECHAEADIEAGNIESALTKCSSRWASMPGNKDGQGGRSVAYEKAAFVAAGGKLSS